MGRFVNQHGVVFSVDDSKDEQYQQAGGSYQPATDEKPAAKRASSKSSSDSK